MDAETAPERDHDDDRRERRSPHSRGGWLRRVVAPLLIMVALLVTGLSWVFASPIGGVPDADFHFASLWCQTGGADSQCERRYLIDGTVAVRTFAAFDSPCYALKPKWSASCEKLNDDTYFTERVNNGGYPQAYYQVMGLLTSDRFVLSTLAIRFVNFSLFTLLLGAVCWLASPVVRRSLVVTMAVCTVPVGIFILASMNPSSWAITGIAVQFFAIIALGDSTGRARGIALGALAAAGGIMAASSRGDAGAYAILVSAVGGWLFFARFRERPWKWLALPIPIIAGALSFLVSRQTSGDVPGRLATEPDAFNFFQILAIPLGNLGIGPMGALGSFDTAMPAATWGCMILALGAVVSSELTKLGWWRALAAAGTAVLLVGLPFYMLTQSGSTVGEFVQPRYVLPLLIVLVGILTVRLEGRGAVRTRTEAMFIAGLVAIAHSAALYANLVRYTNGSDPYLLGYGITWWWDMPVSPQAVWVAGSLAFALALTLLMLGTHPRSASRAALPGAAQGMRRLHKAATA